MLENGKLTKQASNAIKGLALITMLLNHYLIRNFTVNTLLIPSDILILLGKSMRCAVPLFVFVTGYGSYFSLQNTNNYQKWAKRRVLSIWKGYIPFAILCIIIGVAVGWQAYDWARLFEDFTGLHRFADYAGYLGSWWYLPTAYALVLFAPLIKKLVDKYGTYTLIISMILPLVFNFQYTGVDVLFAWLPVLIEGMLLAKCKIKDQHNIFLGILQIIAGILICWLCFACGGYLLWVRFWITTPLIVFGTINICTSKKTAKFLAFLGKYSFGTYLFHPLLYDAFFDFEEMLGSVYWLVPVIVTLAIALAVSVIVTKLSEKFFYKLEAAFH
jgi:surface polysaccharide O-acyltransferase-like enzyme